MLLSLLIALFGGSVDFRALDELAAKYSQASIEAFYERTFTGLDRDPTRERWVFKRDGSRVLREVYPLGGETEFATIALTADGRTVQSQQHLRGWDVFNLSDDGDFSHAMEYVLQFVNAPWSVLGRPLKELMTEPGFKLVSVEPAGEMMELKFTYEPPKDVRRPYRSGTLTMNPRRSWAIEKIVLPSMLGATSTGTITQTMRYDGLKLVSLTEEVANDTTKISATRDISFDIEFGPPPEEAFDPANYGVLDPPRRWNLPLPWMFAGLSAICILLAVWLRRRA